MKRKTATSKFEEMGRRVARLQANPRASSQAAQMNHQIPASESPNRVGGSDLASLSLSKRFKETENVDTPDPELKQSGSETIPTQKDRSWQLESDHTSSCNISAASYTVTGNDLMALVLEHQKRIDQIIQESNRELDNYDAQIQELQEKTSLEKEKIEVAQAENRSIMQLQRLLESEREFETYRARLQELKEKVSLVREKIEVARAENTSIMQTVSNLRRKLKHFVEDSLLHGLL